MSTTNLFVIPAILWCILSGTVVSSDKCQTPQYLQLGKKGMISCNFPGGSYGTCWYNSSNLTSKDRQLICQREGIVFGPGYESGEYRVQPDGSLIINKVSTKHNTSFGVSTLATTEDDPIVEYVRVVVYGTVVSSDKCQTLQYLQLGKKGMISCNFPGGLYGTVWYNSSNLTSEDRQLISNIEGYVFGPGYESGEYRVQPDGSLVINKVSIQHNTYFGVSTLATTEDDPIVEYVRVVVYDTVVSSDKCQPPQYLQLGKKGMISCNFPGGLYGTVWYNSSNLTSEDRQLISNREGFVFEPGYESGEYSVQPDGSLVINKVSTKHNTYFVVSTLATTEDDPIVEYVRVVVYDKPLEPYPTIDATGCYQKSLCFLELNAASSLSCSVLRVGAVLDDLSWKSRTNTGDEHITSQSKAVKISVNELQSYHTVVNISLPTSLSLRLFVCAARSNVSKVGNNESTILVESGTLEASSENLLVTPNERVVMNCGKDVLFFIWKKVGQTEEIIAFGTKSMSEVMMPDGFTLQNNSLVINTVGNPTLGTYTCVYSTDGVTTKFTSTDVTFQEEAGRTSWDVVVVVVLFVMISCIVVLLIVFYRSLSSRRRSSIRRRRPKDILSEDQTRYTHDGIVKRLMKASQDQVDIEMVILRDSFMSVEDNGVAINLSSGAVLPPINTLKSLYFENEKWQQWDLTKLISILQYACHRSPPTEIKIERILLPFEFENKLSTLQQKPSVVWIPGVAAAGLQRINYDTGQWESKTQGPLENYIYNWL
ncbi:uncharacterized protein [Apostichopus japonicus]